MASSQKYAGAGATSGGTGVAWSNPGNIVSDNGSDASTTFHKSADETEYLLADAFGFAIPSGATIDGIEVEIERQQEDTRATWKDLDVTLLKAGTATGDNNGDLATEWPTSMGVATYGGASDLWGTTWTASDVNHADFGVRLKADNTGSVYTARVDFIRITVYYTEPDITVTPGVASLSTSLSAAKLAFAVKPGQASLSSAGQAPKANLTLKLGLATLSSSGLAPVAKVITRPEPGALATALSPLAPTTYLLARAEPGAAALALSPLAPDALLGNTVIPDAIAAALSALAPTTVAHITQSPGAATLATSFYGVGLRETVTPDSLAAALSLLTPTTVNHVVVWPDEGSLALSPLAPSVRLVERVVPDAGALAISLLAPSLKFIDRFEPGPASLLLSPAAPSLFFIIRVSPAVGSLSLAGQAPTIALVVTPGAAGLALSALLPNVILTVRQWLGRILAEVYDPSGALLDEGPFADILAGSYTQELDRIGSFALTVPAAHERAAIFQQRHEVWLYREGEGLVFKGIIDRAAIDATTDGPVLVVQGSSIARRLVFKTTGRGRAYTADTLADVVADLLSGTGMASGSVDTLSYALTGRADSATRWAALEGFAKQARVHLREDVLSETVDASALGADSGITLLNVEAVSSVALASNSSVIPVAGVKVDESSEDLWNRLYPLGAGEGNNVLDLGPSDRISPYTVQSEVGPDGRTQYYIEDAASVASYGLSERWVNVKEAIPLSNDAGAFTAAANALYDVAAGALQVLSEPRREYEVKVPGLMHLDSGGAYRFQVGDKMRLFYRGLAEGPDGATAWLDVNTLLWVMGYTRRFRADGGDDWSIKVANLDRQDRDIGERIAQIQADVRALSVSPRPYNYTRGSGPYRDSVDASYPLDFNVKWDDGTFMLHRSLLTFRVKGVRANATGAASGGTTVPTTSSGGGGTSGADTSHTHSVSGQTAAASGSHRHQMFDYVSTDSTQLLAAAFSDGDGLTAFESASGDPHQHGLSDVQGHTHNVNWDGSFGVALVSVQSKNSGGSDFVHSFLMVNQMNADAYTWEAAADHTHSVSGTTSGGGSSHTHSVAAHTHTVTIPDHTHTLTYGIYQASTPGAPAVGVVINGTDRTSALGGPWNTGQTLDITPYLTTGGLGQPLRQDNTVRLTAALLCDIEVEVQSLASSTSIALPV